MAGSPVGAGSAEQDDQSTAAERLAAAWLARAYRDASGRGALAQDAHAWLLSPPGRRLARLLGYGDHPVPSQTRLRELRARGWAE